MCSFITEILLGETLNTITSAVLTHGHAGQLPNEHVDVIALMLGPPASCCVCLCVWGGGGGHVALKIMR